MRTFYQRNLWAVALLFMGVMPLRAQVINEFVFSHTGTDDQEYIEVFGPPNTDLSDLTLIAIEGDEGSNLGLIDDVFPVGTTDANGYWRTDFLTNVLENSSFTLLLVRDFNAAQGDDIDAGDDGSYKTPWTDTLDAVGISDGGPNDVFYTDVILFSSQDGGSFGFGGASRIPNGFNSGTAKDWVRNSFNLAGIESADPAPGEALNTPGAENTAVPGVRFETTALEVDEDAGTVEILVDLIVPQDTVVSIDIALDGTSTATDGVDFSFSPTTLTFAANDTVSQVVTLIVTDDDVSEGNETVILNLVNPNGSILMNDSTFTLTILDNEIPTLSFSSISQVVDENVGQVTVTVDILNPVNTATTVDVSVDGINSTAMGADYMNLNATTTLTFPANDATSQSFTFDIVDDSEIENAEQIILLLNNANNNGLLGDSVLTITINPSDIPITPIADLRNAVDADLNPTLPSDSILTIVGVVHGPDLRGGNGIQFTLIDGPNAKDGIALFSFVDVAPTDLVEGDSIATVGNVSSFNGLMQFTPLVIERVSQGNALQTPAVVDTLNEDTESRVIQLENVIILDSSQWNGGPSAGGSGFNLDIQLGVDGDTVEMRIDDETELFGLTYSEVFGTDTSNITLTGIGSQRDTNDPRDSGYQIFIFDFEDVSSPNQPAPPQPSNSIVFISINDGADVFQGVPFDVVLQAQDESGDSVVVSADTRINLSVNFGTGNLAGTTTGTIPAGSSSVTIPNVAYDVIENGVVLLATVTSGDALASGVSLPFDVVVNPNPTALPGTLQSGTLKLFPNPGLGIYRMAVEGEAAKEVSIQVFSSTGELKLTDKGLSQNGIFDINMTSLPAGQYILKLTIGEETIARRVIKN